MKRVALLAAATVPAALGLVLPQAADAAVNASAKPGGVSGKIVSAHPLSFFRFASGTGCGDINVVLRYDLDCLTITGKSNDVTSILLSGWPHKKFQKDSLRVGYKVNNGAYHSKWKTHDFSWNYSGSWRWYPQCSFPTTTHVTGYSTGPNKDKGTLNVFGSNYRGLHPCA